ncbi:hypothetical protein M1O50_05190, partial [Dehalococcoidia bacterium]|nr:hypothetical protein [Dehalococcoidia bacterium]
MVVILENMPTNPDSCHVFTTDLSSRACPCEGRDAGKDSMFLESLATLCMKWPPFCVFLYCRRQGVGINLDFHFLFSSNPHHYNCWLWQITFSVFMKC